MKSTKNFNLKLFEASDMDNVEGINKNTQQIDEALTSLAQRCDSFERSSKKTRILIQLFRCSCRCRVWYLLYVSVNPILMIFTDKAGHLVSDQSLDELHRFAASIGLKQEWFQNKRIPHYDLTTARMKSKAIAAGAMLCGSKAIIRNARKNEKDVDA